MAATVIGSASITFTGSWSGGGSGGYSNETYYFASAGAGAIKANWQFTGLSSSTQYCLAISWVEFANRATNTPWKIYDGAGTGGTVLASGTVNQVLKSSGPRVGTTRGGNLAIGFRWLGTVTTGGSSTALTVEITNNANGFVIADAALLQPASDSIQCAAIATGNWSTSSTWQPRLPIAGDSVVIGDSVALTLDSAATTANSITVGSDPGTGSTPAIQFVTEPVGSHSLTVNTGLTLRLRGDLEQDGAQTATPTIKGTMTIAAGTSLIFDPKSGATYKWFVHRNSRFISQGSAGSHCTVKTDLARGGNVAYMVMDNVTSSAVSIGTSWGGLTNCTYTDFSWISGDGTNADNPCGLWWYGGTQNNTLTTENVTIDHCTFDHCNFWALSEFFAYNGTFTFTNNVFTNSVLLTYSGFTGDKIAFSLGASVPTPPTSQHPIQNNSFDGRVNYDGVLNAITSGNVFGNGITSGNSTAWSADTMFDNNWVGGSTNPTLMPGSIKNCYFAPDTPYNLQFSAGKTANGCVFGFGAAIASSNNGAMTVKFCLLINQAGSAENALCQVVNTSGAWTIEHCTAYGDNACIVNIGVSGNSYAAELTHVRACIVRATASTAAYVVDDKSVTATNNAVSDASYNGLSGATTGSNTINGVGGQSKLGYNGCKVTAGTQLGDHDLSANPNFADETRNFATWGSTQHGTAATYAGAKAYLLANPSQVASLRSWVFAGFMPTNASYRNATYPGDAATLDASGGALNGTVGSMGISSSGGGAVKYLIQAGRTI